MTHRLIIDCHHHLGRDPNYAARLVDECARLSIAKVCTIAPFGEEGNDRLAALLPQYGNTILGFALVRWAEDTPDDIVRYHDQGFTGLKFIIPPAPYDDERWFLLYEKAQDLGMPCLFHLGIVARSDEPGHMLVRNDYMRPIYLDTIARRFPRLQIIGAHLGNPWYEEAAMACRWNPNLYFDLSGSTLKAKKPRFLDELLWWTPFTRYRDPEGRHAWEKIVFGSDVPYYEIHDVLHDYHCTMSTLGLSEELKWKVLGGTAARILGVGDK